jgi:H+/Cl- antiporter ClcA
VAIAVVCGAVSLFTPATTDSGNDLSQDFENTLLASVDQGDSMP